jgi:hypothetical protein
VEGDRISFINELIAIGEGRGQAEGNMTVLVGVLNERFQAAPSDHDAAISGITDLTRLRVLLSTAVKASTIEELRRVSGM